MLLPQSLLAAKQDSIFVLRPHCEKGYDSLDTAFGPLPDLPALIRLGDGHCPGFLVEDPQTLKTEPMQVGDVLDIDLVIQNPSKQKIARARAWLSYDPNILEGTDVTLFDHFPNPTPGETDFSAGEGYVKIEASTDPDNRPGMYWIPVARIRFTVLKHVPPGTVISFYNVQRNGHTTILADEDGDEEYIIGGEPGSLLVVFETGGAEGPLPDGSSCTEDTDCLSGLCVDGICQSLLPDGEACTADDQCLSGVCTDGICGVPTLGGPGDSCTTDDDCDSKLCYEGICRDGNFKIPDGEPCRRDNQCASFLCLDGFCASPTDLANGESCSSFQECKSNYCDNGVCADPPQEDEPECRTDSDCDDGVCVDGSCQTAAQPEPPSQRTAFSLLQIRNLRATTEGTSVFLAWDPLQSSILKAYNVYYGTTTGQYIQRKIIPGTTNTVTIRNLPSGTKYYFAVRGVSTADEESAFSEEVSITVGDPDTSSAPLVASVLTDSPGENPLPDDGPEEMPGEVGSPKVVLAFVLISAVMGTFIAARRQFLTTKAPPAHE